MGEITNKDVCIVIPIYKDNIDNPILYDEVESIYHTIKLMNKYDIYFLCHPDLNISFYKKFEDLQNKFKSFFDIPKQNELGEKFPWCGYIDINGKKYVCEQCEHESIIRQIVLNEYLKEYLSVPASFYDHKPQGTFQEEYFAMKYLGFAKVSAFEDAPTKRILFFYDKLTWKQSAQIYPT